MPRQIVHVSYQDPDHLLGGQGWAVYNLAKAQVRNGGLVYWISPCIKYEQPGEFLYENGSLKVIKLKFTDEFVSSLFANGAEIHRLRVKFGDLAVDFIKHFFDPSECVVHLHGFIETPRRSSELRAAGYPAISTFHMLLSSRNQAMGTGDGVFLEQQPYLALYWNLY